MKSDFCTICPKKCHYSKHFNADTIYINIMEEEYVTCDDLLKNYEVALGKTINLNQMIE